MCFATNTTEAEGCPKFKAAAGHLKETRTFSESLLQDMRILGSLRHLLRTFGQARAAR